MPIHQEKCKLPAFHNSLPAFAQPGIIAGLFISAQEQHRVGCCVCSPLREV